MYLYYGLMFLSSACIMTLELVAGRLAAPYLGVSLFTWTGVIGAVLFGMTIGAVIGGWLADRYQPRPLLGWVLVSSGILVSLTLPAAPWILGKMVPHNWPPLAGVFFPLLLLFGLPVLVIGAISPTVYKLALKDPAYLGRAVGLLSASGIAGSILGTYATGFWLIPALGTRTIIVGVAALLALLGLLVLPWRRRLMAGGGVLLVLVALSMTTGLARMLESECAVESGYYCIKISYDGMKGDPGTVKQLVLDHLIHSGIRPDDPDELWYSYEKVMAWLITARERPAEPTFFIGGGAYILPAWMVSRLPDARVDVAEIDPAVTEIAFAEFVPGSDRIRSFNMDARLALKDLPPEQKYGVVVGDAFHGVSVPYHLTTLEFTRIVRSRLLPGGIYILNLIDQPDGPFLGAMAATLRAAEFPHVYLLGGNPGATSGTSSTWIMVGSLEEIDWEAWGKKSAPVFALPPVPIQEGHRALTDDHAPVDSLLQPVFTSRWRR